MMDFLQKLIVSVVIVLLVHRVTSASTWQADDFDDDVDYDLESNDVEDAPTSNEKNTKSQEGDMKVTKIEELAEKGKIHLDFPLEDLSKWKTTEIPYAFSKKFDGKDAIMKAFDEYKKKSCITFRPKTKKDRNYIYFYNGRGCWSFVGPIGGKQHISLPHYCRTTLGTPVHEILHALGFYHEQSRGDRDKYVEVEWVNIKPRAKGNFAEHPAQDNGYPYDYDSVMHYSDHSFSKNGKVTLKVLKGHHKIGQRRGLSKIDAALLNSHYCGGKWGPNGKRETHSDAIEYKAACNGEEGEVCEDETAQDCTSLIKDGQCYKCSVAKKCPSCLVADVKDGCPKWVGQCTKPNYRNWMSINCATSCKDKCVKE